MSRSARAAVDDDFAPADCRPGPKVDDLVGFPDRLFVMFDDDDGIAHIAQMFEGVDQLLIVARMQADGGFIENVGDADKSAANLRGEAHPLRLSARERGGCAVEGEVVEAHLFEELEAAGESL